MVVDQQCYSMKKMMSMVLVEFVAQLLFLVMWVVVVRGSLCSAMSSRWLSHLDLVVSDVDREILVSCRCSTGGSPSDLDVLALVVGSLVVELSVGWCCESGVQHLMVLHVVLLSDVIEPEFFSSGCW